MQSGQVLCSQSFNQVWRWTLGRELLFTWLRTASTAKGFINVIFSFSDQNTFVNPRIVVLLFWGWNLKATLPGSILSSSVAAAWLSKAGGEAPPFKKVVVWTRPVIAYLRSVRNHLTCKMSLKLMGSGIQCFLNVTARKLQVLDVTHIFNPQKIWKNSFSSKLPHVIMVRKMLFPLMTHWWNVTHFCSLLHYVTIFQCH